MIWYCLLCTSIKENCNTGWSRVLVKWNSAKIRKRDKDGCSALWARHIHWPAQKWGKKKKKKKKKKNYPPKKRQKKGKTKTKKKERKKLCTLFADMDKKSFLECVSWGWHFIVEMFCFLERHTVYISMINDIDRWFTLNATGRFEKPKMILIHCGLLCVNVSVNIFILTKVAFGIPLNFFYQKFYYILVDFVSLFIHNSTFRPVEYLDYILCKGLWLLQKEVSLVYTLNCICCWGSSSGDPWGGQYSQVHFNQKPYYLLGSHLWVRSVRYKYLISHNRVFENFLNNFTNI